MKFQFGQVAILIIILFKPYSGFSQKTSSIDTLMSDLHEAKSKEEKAIACYNIGYYYDEKEDYENAIQYFSDALELYIELDDSKKIVDLHNCLGANYELMGESDKGLKHFRKSCQTAKIIGDSNGLGDALHNLGIMSQHYLSYDSAAWYFEQAIRVREKLEDTTEHISSVLALAEVLSNLGHHQKALNYCYLTRKIQAKLDDANTQACLEMMIADIYYELGQPDSVIYYYQRMIDVSKKANFKRGLAVAYANLGSFYQDQKELQKALKYQLLSLEIEKSLGHEYGIASSYYLISCVYIDLEDYSKALSYLNLSAELCDTTMIEDWDNILLGYYTAYKAIGNQAMALKYYEKHVEFHEKVTELEVQEKVAEIETKYETEKKSQEIKILQQDNMLKSQHLRLLMLILVGLGIILILLMFLVSYIRQKGKLKLQSMKLELENYMLQINELMEEKQNTDNSELQSTFFKKYDISERESEVLYLIGAGYSNTEIAEKIFVSANTVKFHIKNIYLKLDVKNRVEALNKMKNPS